MGVPDFVLELRRHVGTMPLWLIGCTAVVLDEGPTGRRLLTVRRADNGAYTPVTGIVDPGEHPAAAAVRETLEETGVTAEVVALAQVGVTSQVRYGNGDRTQYLDLTFRCRYITGDPHPADGENTEAFWSDVTDLPPMSEHMHARIDAALSGESAPRMVTLET